MPEVREDKVCTSDKQRSLTPGRYRASRVKHIKKFAHMHINFIAVDVAGVDGPISRSPSAGAAAIVTAPVPAPPDV